MAQCSFLLSLTTCCAALRGVVMSCLDNTRTLCADTRNHREKQTGGFVIPISFGKLFSILL